MTPVTHTNLNKLLLIRDIQEIAKTYINDDRSYRWIWKNKIADVYHIGYVTFMNYISVPSINAKIDEAIAKKKLGLDLSTYNLLNELDFIIEPTLDYIIKPQLAKLSKFIPDEQIPKVVNSYLDAAISKATAKGSVNLFGFEFEATAFQNLKREIDNSLKNNVSHDERPA